MNKFRHTEDNTGSAVILAKAPVIPISNDIFQNFDQLTRKAGQRVFIEPA